MRLIVLELLTNSRLRPRREILLDVTAELKVFENHVREGRGVPLKRRRFAFARTNFSSPRVFPRRPTNGATTSQQLRERKKRTVVNQTTEARNETKVAPSSPASPFPFFLALRSIHRRHYGIVRVRR